MKTVFITGASSGIGKATAQLFSKKGWNVVATMRNPQKETELKGLPGVSLLELDVTNDTSIQKAIDETLKYHATIDVVVNNAGYGALGCFESSSWEQVKRQFDTNVFGLMQVTKAVLPQLRKQKSGVIINIASIAGHIGFPAFSLYNSSKFAVEGFSESLAFELQQFGITVKLVEPGPINTDFYSRSMDMLDDTKFPEYAEYIATIKKNMVQSGGAAQGPEVVARKIYKAATDGCTKLRYPVGGGAPFMILAKRFLPYRVVKLMIKTVMTKK